jgi:predicted kinase
MTELVLMVGLPGSGKTTRARRIAAELGALRFTPDEWMMPLFGSATPELAADGVEPPRPTDPVGDAADPRGPRPDGRRDVLEGRLLTLGLRALDVGTSVVLDFGFWGRDERRSLFALARARGASCRVDYAEVTAGEQSQRIADRHVELPHAYEPLADDLLAEWRAMFQAPDADELAGRTPGAAPAGWRDWAEWAEWRWPSLDARPPA